MSRIKHWLGLVTLPAIIVTFFALAPKWYNSYIQNEFVASVKENTELSEERKSEFKNVYSQVDFQMVCLRSDAKADEFRAYLEEIKVCQTFSRLDLARQASFGLIGLLVVTLLALGLAVILAQRSRSSLVFWFPKAWKLMSVSAILKVLVETPLLVFACYELTVLLSNSYSPKLLFILGAGGACAAFFSVKSLFMRPPLEFGEGAAREVSKNEAPLLWEAIKDAAQRLNTEPPQHVIVGMSTSFFVTEFSVRHSEGLTSGGKTLYLSYPLMMHLSEEEVLSVIGHELGHFIGEDTKLTREFYPLNMKIDMILQSLRVGGIPSFSSFLLMKSFRNAFGKIERSVSRLRELSADQIGASLTNAQTTAKTLIKIHALGQAFYENADTKSSLYGNLESSLSKNPQFLTELLKSHTIHPMDTHPPLADRLKALNFEVSREDALAIVKDQPKKSAFATWLEKRQDLFQGIMAEQTKVFDEISALNEIAEANISTLEGKALLEKSFPAHTYKMSPTKFYFMFTLMLVFVVGMLAGGGALFYFDKAIPMIGFSLLAGGLLTLICTFIFFKNYFNSQLVVDVEGLSHSGWNRKMYFDDILSMTTQNTYYYVTLHLKFKTKQARFWGYRLLPWSAKKEKIDISIFRGKSTDILDLIVSYWHRIPSGE